MVALTAGAARAIGLQCVCRKDLSEDEHLLLDVLRLSQRHVAAGQATFLLEDILTQTALPIAAVKAQALAEAFNQAHLRFPARGPDAAVAGFSAATPSRGGTEAFIIIALPGAELAARRQTPPS